MSVSNSPSYNEMGAALVQHKMNELTCSNANCDKPKDKPCSRCEQVYYCSESCQRADWPKHKEQCYTFKPPAELDLKEVDPLVILKSCELIIIDVKLENIKNILLT